jgi:hypothetical protein
MSKFLPPVPPEGPSVVPAPPVPQAVLADIKITCPSGMGGSAAVEIDGHRTNMLYTVKYEINADNFATVTLGMVAQHFKYDGKALIHLDDETKAALKVLGWTAPEGE